MTMESINTFAPIVREFLVSIAQNEIMSGGKYSERIEINDGGYSSYIELCVDIDDYNKSRKKGLQGIRLFRHSNSVQKLDIGWGFALGDICNPYCDNPEISIGFTTHGMDVDSAQKEAQAYFADVLSLVRKSTALMKMSAAESAEKERAQLLARLEELDNGGEKA